MKRENRLRPRPLYLRKLAAFQDAEPVKVITGIRRCGKSSLMKLMAAHLRQGGVADDQIIEMNFESMAYRGMDAAALYDHVKERVPKDRRAYLFFDEVQHVGEWQDAVNSFRVDLDCDIYVTGSNAWMLSGEYATYLAGRCVEIKMLPLSFAEFLDFHGYTVARTADGVRAYDADGERSDLQELLGLYMRFGGMPGLADVGFDTDKAFTLLDGIYSTVVMRDIVERERRRGQRQVRDTALLRKIIMFLADNIGNNTSLTTVGSTLKNEKLLPVGKGVPAAQTVQAYAEALLEAYMFYEIKRFDIKGREYLKTLGKYYIADIGLRNYILGLRGGDAGHILENVVYLELLRRGFDVAVGKVGEKEIDFVASNVTEKFYIQVSESVKDPATRERELAPFRKLHDSYRKIVLTNDGTRSVTEDGIEIVPVIDFLLEGADG